MGSDHDVIAQSLPVMSVTDFGNAHTAPVPTLQSIQPFLPSISDPAGL